MKRVALAMVLPLVVGGCSGISPLSIASFALDGVSLAATGQTTTDHVLSAMVEKDCRLLNFWISEPICKPFAEGERSLIAEIGDQPLQPPVLVGAHEVGGTGENWRHELRAMQAEEEALRLLATDLPRDKAVDASSIAFERLSLDYDTVAADGVARVVPAAFDTEAPAPRPKSTRAAATDGEVRFERRTHIVTATLPDRETAELVAGAQGYRAKVVEARTDEGPVFRVAHTDVGERPIDPLIATASAIASLPSGAADGTPSGAPVATLCHAEVCGVRHEAYFGGSDSDGGRAESVAFAEFGRDR